MKSRLFLLFLLSTICVEIISQAPSRSILTDEWKVGGVFYGRSPQEEILSARTEFTKKFDRGNGLVDVYFGGPFHYKDKNGFLQDISLSIKLLSHGLFSFVNEENNFISRFSNTHSNGVLMERNGNVISFGLNTKIFSGNWSPVSNSNLKAVINDNKIQYQHIYNNIDIEYEVNTELIKQQVLFKDRSIFEGIPAGQQFFSVQEKIILPQQSVLSDRNGIIKERRNINGDLLVSLNNEIIYTIKESFIWDASFKGNPDEQKFAADFIDSFKPVLTSVELLSADTVLLTTYVPVAWLISPQRVFPIILDPTVGIGNQSSFNSSYRYPFNTCRQQRVSQILFRKSDINAGGINTTGTITDIAFFQNTPVPLAINNLQVKMQEVAWTEMTTPTLTSSGFTTVYGPSTQTFTSGSNTWRTLSLATPFSFTNTRNLLIEARFANSTFTPGCNCDNTAPGGYWGWYNAPYAGHRWAYSNSAAPPPSGASCEYNNSPERNPAYGYFIPATRITINTTGGCVPITFTTQPQAQSVVAPAQAQFSVVVAGSTPAYQWQKSIDGGATWANVSGAAYSGATTNQLTINPTNATMNGDRFRCRVTNSCTNPSPVTSGQGVLTVNAAGCATILTPAASPIIPAAGGTGSFSINVTPNTCSWSASENQSWLTIISPLNGTGDATLNYSVTANTGGPRSAAITVNGQIHTVNQLGAAAPTTYTISGRVIENGSTGLQGVYISTTPNQGTAITDAQGYYTINVPLSYTGTVRATLAPYTFTPLTRTVSSTSFSNKDFDALGVSINILPTSSIYPWQREGDDIVATINVSMGTTTTDWRLKADVYDINNVLTSVSFPSTTALTYTINTAFTNPVANQTFKNLCKNGGRVEYIAIYIPNPSITDTIRSTKIIEKKWDRKNIVYFNDPVYRDKLRIPIKWNPNLLQAAFEIKFDRDDRAARVLETNFVGIPKLQKAETLKGNNPNNSITIIQNGYFIVDYSNSNISEALAGDFTYEMFTTSGQRIETGKFDLTKVGRIDIENTGSSKNLLIMVGGIFNEIEASIKNLRNNSSCALSEDCNLTYSVIEHCRKKSDTKGYATWYVSQGNANSVIRNAYDIGLGIERIMKINLDSFQKSTDEIALVCHSKGGLDVRGLIANASGYSVDYANTIYFDFNKLNNKIKKIGFFDTPHKGADKRLQWWAITIASLEVYGADDLRKNSDIVKKLAVQNIPTGIKFLNMSGYLKERELHDDVVKVEESQLPVPIPLHRLKQLYQHDARQFCVPGTNQCPNILPRKRFHEVIHSNAALTYRSPQKYNEYNCTESVNNLQKTVEFFNDGNPSSCWQFSLNSNIWGSGSILSGLNLFYKRNGQNELIGITDEIGFATLNKINNYSLTDTIFFFANGYDSLIFKIDSNFLLTRRIPISLIKSSMTDQRVQYPSLSLPNQNIITSQPQIQIKATGRNISGFLINQHSAENNFIPLALINNIATIPLDTGYNKIIVKFCGIDTAVQMKEVYYLPDTLMSDYAMDCSVTVPTAFNNSKMFVNNVFYKDISGSSTFKLLQGISEVKFSKYGYRDTVFIVDTVTTINLSMQPYSYSSLTDSSIFNFNNRPNPQYWKTITIKNMTSISNRQLSVKQYDDPFTGMSLKPQTRKFAFRRMGATSEAAYYKTAIALDQVNTPDKDSVYLLSIKGNRYIKYLPNVSGVTEYDPEVQKMVFDKLDFTSNSTHEIVLMQKQPPVMKPMDTIWHSGQTLVFPISMFVQDPDSIKNDITASSADVKVTVNGNLVYVTAPVNFVGTTSFTITGTHDWLDSTRTYTMKVIPPEVFIPTGFTPNNDGRNDVIRPVFMGKLQYCHFSVYNRIGQKVFETRDCLAGWDGKIRGTEQSTGTYVYYLVYRFEGTDEKENNVKGVFTLIR